ncbi:hypothetical protein P171DRAFT_480887 [Karstenula rhodostoma CBS 690.94]|uniref:Uncharacterized protein n=1 Tax=Karstenula rhodostoma CBS 690.94 TaxID=1392251 RepID=A0A9P4UHR2_9PLEO|nr:hypothetical protein P171DRAFT_480887 [Karstenula rhodostoma CBS 690.94]
MKRKYSSHEEKDPDPTVLEQPPQRQYHVAKTGRSAPRSNRPSNSQGPAGAPVSSEACGIHQESKSDLDEEEQGAPSTPPPPQEDNPAQPAPPPGSCDDWICCGQARQTPCGVSRTCTGPGTTRAGLQHPIQVCNVCNTHDEYSVLVAASKYVDHTPRSGFRAKLCKSCTLDEMQLYWHRVSMPPSDDPSAQEVLPGNWPGLDAQGNPTFQDFCTCINRILLLHNPRPPPRWPVFCHACRERWFPKLAAKRDETDICTYALDVESRNRYLVLNPASDLPSADFLPAQTDLRTKTANVVSGKKPLAYAHPSSGRMSARVLASRMARRIGPRCPCGKESVPMNPNGQELIEYCMVCMGVVVKPHWVAGTGYERDRIMRPRPVTRSMPGGVPRFHPTLGPLGVERSPRFRVNIERGWKFHPGPHQGEDDFVDRGENDSVDEDEDSSVDDG